MKTEPELPGVPARGIAAAAGAYFFWGLLPVYWKLLAVVSPYEILAHRMVWSLLLTLVILVACGRLNKLLVLFTDKKAIGSYALSSSLLGVNWLIYIWAVNNGFIIEASLGYYINPLVTVGMAVLFLKERLRAGQVGALFIAAFGVAYLTFVYGRFPWIALSLALSFAIYGLLHKKTRVAPVEGLCFETVMFFVPGVAILVVREMDGAGAFLHGGVGLAALLAGTGVVTTIPLLLFAYAAQKIPLSLLGILQYSAPTLNLLLGIFVYHEGFPQSRLVGFALVGSALLLFLLEGVFFRARLRRLSLGNQARSA